MFRRLLLTLGTAAAWFLPGHLAILALLVLIWGSAMTAANTAKTRNVEDRVNNLVTKMVGHSASIDQLNKGIFTNVSGGATITLDTQQGSVTLHCGALSNFTSGPQTAWLASTTQMGPWGTIATDPNSGPNWANGERHDYMNAVITLVNNIIMDLRNHNIMLP
jgi:hypothetical protein